MIIKVLDMVGFVSQLIGIIALIMSFTNKFNYIGDVLFYLFLSFSCIAYSFKEMLSLELGESSGAAYLMAVLGLTLLAIAFNKIYRRNDVR